ncbi:NfuA family Fe-S biogenesis protein [Frateuria aurantia]
MIEISERAQAHFLRLLQQQHIDDLGIRISATAAGTPEANCELSFCEPSELDGNEWSLDCEGFTLYVDGAAAPWLEGASIDFEPQATGGVLNIRAPRIKGEVPGEDAGMIARVQYVLDAEVNPQIAAHGGRVSLVEVTADGVVWLRFGGGCHGCGMADVTLKQGIETTLKSRVPQITAVRDATDHSTGDQPYYAQRGEGASVAG